MKRLLTLCVLSLLFSSAVPRDRRWMQIGPGAPGIWAPVAADPQGTGTIYVASIGGGVRKSIDNGVNWSTVNSGLNGTAIYALAMDASGPNTMYAGVFNLFASGVFKTTNGGTTWTLTTPQISMFIPVSLAADPRVAGRVYVGVLNGPLYKTEDGGDNWVRVFNGTNAITSIVVDPFDSNIVYASTLGGLLKSIDAGMTWTMISLSSLPARLLWRVAVDPANDQVLYVASDTSGVWRSGDAGVSWTPTGTLPVAPYSIVVDASPAHTIFAATAEGVWESLDDGLNWQPTGLTNKLTNSITTGPEAELYAGTSTGLAVSHDHGATWTYPDPTQGGAQAFGYAVVVDPHFSRKLFVSTLGSAARISNDRGDTWSPVDVTFAARESRTITVDPTDSNRVYAGSFYSGLFKSVDGGSTWSRRNFGSGSAYVWLAIVDPVSPNIVYAGTAGEGLFKSEDFGETWKSVPNMPATVQGITVDPRNHNDMWFGTGIGVLRLHDGVLTNVLARPAWNITLVSGEGRPIYATTKTAGVFRSLDGGTTWSAINNGITNLQMGRAAPVILDPDDSHILYVGSEGGGGVFKSTDGGESWFPLNQGLFDTSVFGLASDPHRPGTLYACGPHGVFTIRLRDE